jgi:hypothetical protein
MITVKYTSHTLSDRPMDCKETTIAFAVLGNCQTLFPFSEDLIGYISTLSDTVSM